MAMRPTNFMVFLGAVAFWVENYVDADKLSDLKSSYRIEDSFLVNMSTNFFSQLEISFVS